MNDDRRADRGESDRDIAKLLAAAGPREDMPEELKTRWEAHFRAELAANRPDMQRSYMLPLVALAASIVVLVLVLDYFAADPAGSTPMQVQSVAGEVQVLVDERRRLAAVAGQNLAAGVTLQTGRAGRLALRWAGYDVRLNASSRLVLMKDHLELTSGEIYISDRGRRPRKRRIAVVTPYAIVSDIGTQFRVRLTSGSVVSSVRRGSILVSTESGEHRADATADEARQVTVNADRSVELSRDDSDWGWIYSVAARFEIDGRTVFEFLQWSVNETGRELRFADEGAALAARNTRLSGGVDLSGLNPDRAVEVVLSTTRFTAEAQAGGGLLVSRRSE